MGVSVACAWEPGRLAYVSEARRNRAGWMVRKISTAEDDGAFDREFWSRQSPEQRFEAAWQCVLDWAAMKGVSESELRLQRSIVRVQRR